jgi:2-hydroxychromene-2-carboxylate isomerase
MALTIDYYLAPQSPWTYLGHTRFTAMAKAAGAAVNLMPTDLSRVFEVSGGLPLAKRPRQRQAYRLVELRRFSEHLHMPLHLQPAFFPVAADAAAKLIIAVAELDGTDAAMALAGRILAGVWADERNIADRATLAAILAEVGLEERRLDDSATVATQERYDANTQAAIDTGVFGAPTYVIDGEMFWGQDRLDFVERRLARGSV